MIIKVCGMRTMQNISDTIAAGADMIGFIFYDKSPRYVSEIASTTPSGIARVGIFVNNAFRIIVSTAEKNNLSHIQLHGSENRDMCDALRREGYKVIKTISILNIDDLKMAEQYHGHADILLFDTKTDQYGGSGERFDWSIIDSYTGETPFLLSGGISCDSVHDIKNINHSKLLGIDLNSKFEITPAIKDIKKLEKFIKTIRQ